MPVILVVQYDYEFLDPIILITSFQTGLTALHVAAHYGQMEFCREMLSQVPATIRSEQPHVPEATAAAVPVSEIGTEVT